MSYCLFLFAFTCGFFADFFQSDAMRSLWLCDCKKHKKLKQERVFPIIVLSRVGLLFRHEEVTPKPVLL